MKKKFQLLLLLCTINSFSQEQINSREYLKSYSIELDSINQLTFIDKESFKSFLAQFEDKQGFELPKFLIFDNSGKLLKHRLDVLISECGKGDVQKLKKNYFKKLPDLDSLNLFFKYKITKPNDNEFVVIFIWHQVADKYNKHTFETYHTWKNDQNITFYFLNLNFE